MVIYVIDMLSLRYSSYSCILIFLDHQYTVDRNKTETVLILLCMLLLYHLVFYCIVSRLRRLLSYKDPGCFTLLTLGPHSKVRESVTVVI